MAETEMKLQALSVNQKETPTKESENGNMLVAVRGEMEKASTKTFIQPTTTRTRERLAEAEKNLAMTSTRTREKLQVALAELERHKTTTRTREELKHVESELVKQRTREISSFTGEVFQKKQEMLRRMLAHSKNVDVAFVLDCTGSMAGYINEAKNQIRKIVEEVTEMYDNKMRVAFIGYRDHCDGPNRIESLEFTRDTGTFERFLTGVAATGGGDAPEDVLGGLEAALNLTWSSASKVIFHIGDAPQHGARFHDLGGDSHPGPEPRGLVVEALFRTMSQIGVKYYFGKVNNSTDKMFDVFKSLGDRDMVNEVNMRSPNLFSVHALTSITSTIEGTLSATVGMARSMRFMTKGTRLSTLGESSDGEKKLKRYSISDAEPDDADLEPQKKVHWLKCIIEAGCISNIREHIGSINHVWSNQMVKKAKDPFAEGTQRIS